MFFKNPENVLSTYESISVSCDWGVGSFGRQEEGELVLGPLHGDSVKDYSSPEASSQTSDMTKKKKGHAIRKVQGSDPRRFNLLGPHS